ncbi:hypothetical protein [Undibacterium sp. Di24W]|uniref:hypothetical protein n=1 Tax=Undibacterium sp. Di24W TaxID=3413033 RepID=UPI003BF355A3
MSQLDLFPATPRKSGHELVNKLLSSAEIQKALMDLFKNQPNKVFGVSEIIDAVSEYKAGFCIGHILSRLEYQGKITSKKLYFGSDHPAKPNYQGFSFLYQLASNT